MPRNVCTSDRNPSLDEGFSESQGDTEFFTATESINLSTHALDSNRLLYLDLTTGNIDYATPKRKRSSSASHSYSVETSQTFLPSAYLAEVVGGDMDSPIFSANSRIGSYVACPDSSICQTPSSRNTQKSSLTARLNGKCGANIPRNSQSIHSQQRQPSHDNARESKTMASGALHRIISATTRRRKRSHVPEMRRTASISCEKDHPVTRKKSFKYVACAKQGNSSTILSAIAQHGFDRSTIQLLPPSLRQYFFNRTLLPRPKIQHSTLFLGESHPLTDILRARPVQQQSLNSLVYQKYRRAAYSSKANSLPTFTKLFPDDRSLLTKRERHLMAKSLALEVLLRRTVAAKVAYRLQNAYPNQNT